MTAALTRVDLDQRLTAVDRSVLLVPPRVLRRVIRGDRHLAGLLFSVPHRKSYAVSRTVLLDFVSLDELRLASARQLPEHVLLLPEPSAATLRRPAPEVLRRYWSLLFHTRIDLEVTRRGGRGRLSDAELRSRIGRIGDAAFAEVRAVLDQERFLFPDADDRAVYEEFAAVFLELTRFAPERLPHFFPGLDRPDRVERLLAEDLGDVDALLAATRPEGAGEPAPPPPVPVEEDLTPAPAPAPDGAERSRLLDRAAQALARGNAVRAAVLRQRAAVANQPGRKVARLAALGAIDALLYRLAPALDLSPEELLAWREPLHALVEPAAFGFWNQERRLLFDLQNACVDREHAIYAVDLVEWARSLFRKPVKRLLPHQGLVLRLKHLRSALARVGAARMAVPLRDRLEGLLRLAIDRGAEALRERLRPLLYEALDAVGLVPTNYPERLARDRVVEELLDEAAERGHLAMSDLRDALARHRLKLPDLSSPGEWLVGDPLLRANRRLADSLDGVYHRAEVYLRLLQRFSSLFFGTPWGRLLTLYVLLPVLGAAVLLEGVQHVVDPVHRLLYPPPGLGYVAAEVEDPGDAEVHGTVSQAPRLLTPWTLAPAALFLLLLIHSPPFRRAVLAGLRWLWQALRALCYDWPRQLLDNPLTRALLAGWPWRLFRAVVLKPALWTAPVVLLLHLVGVGRDLNFLLRKLGLPPVPLSVRVGAVFACLCLLLNSRPGRQLEEALAESAVRTGRWLGGDLLPAAFRLVMDFFKRLLERTDRLIYAVDEYLRFRQGDSALGVACKAVLGVVWFAVTYVVRFAVNLLIEPQINPIKHFPVVTVSHKVMLLLLEPTARVVTSVLDVPLAEALTLTGTVFALIPGVFGFLVWELRANWRLYKANQPAEVAAARVGGHGETVRELLHPGFHSGTLPKLYARLRREERHRDERGAAASREHLHHVLEALRRFGQRHLAAVLVGSRSWGGPAVTVGPVAASTNRLRLSLACPALGPEPLLVDLVDCSGWLTAGVAQPGWLAGLSPERRAALNAALLGFYHQSEVDLVREQVAELLPPGSTWEATATALRVRGPDGAVVWYDLEAEQGTRPLRGDGTRAGDWRRLSATRLLLSARRTKWADWVELWERDQAGKGVAATPNVLPP